MGEVKISLEEYRTIVDIEHKRERVIKDLRDTLDGSKAMIQYYNHRGESTYYMADPDEAIELIKQQYEVDVEAIEEGLKLEKGTNEFLIKKNIRLKFIIGGLCVLLTAIVIQEFFHS
jgi:hypothetical protein